MIKAIALVVKHGKSHHHHQQQQQQQTTTTTTTNNILVKLILAVNNPHFHQYFLPTVHVISHIHISAAAAAAAAVAAIPTNQQLDYIT